MEPIRRELKITNNKPNGDHVLPYIMLDRDGVINKDSDAYIKSPDEWEPIPGSPEAIALLHKNGYKIVVITNQSGLGRGLFSLETLSLMHAKMHRSVEAEGGKIEGIYFCPHGPDEGCDCRKPRPGLLKAFAQDKGVELKNIPFVGDTLKDIEAAVAVGAQPILVKTGKGAKTWENNPSIRVPVFENLYDAATYIISRK